MSDQITKAALACTGCGSTAELGDLQAKGHISCCPERDMQPTVAGLAARIKMLEAALKPFADYADARRQFPADLAITLGSRLAKRQLSMGDCYAALDTLSDGRG